MRSRVFSFAAILCIALGCAAGLARVASGQIRLGSAETAKLESSVHAEDLIMTTLALNLCVDGSATYPCPPNVLTDSVYIPSITLTYGQILDGVVAYSSAGGEITSGTITIYKAAPPSNVRVAVCTLVIGVDHACPPNSTIFDVGNYTLSATLSFPPGSMFAGFDTSVGPCSTTPTCDVTVAVAKDTSSTRLTSSANPAGLGTSVTFTAVVSGGYPAAGTGDVVFTVDGLAEPAVPLDANGAGSYTTAALALGMHTISASYAGALDFLPAEDVSIVQQIVPPMTATTIASSLNPSILGENVTFTATVATALPGITPAGAVTFKDGTASFATVLVNPKGALNIAQSPPIATLGAGTHSITAIYSGDAATSASVSPVLVQQVEYPLTVPPPGYTIAVTPVPVVLGTGQTAHLKVTVTPVSGFLGAVALSCSNLPKESACTFGDATIPAGGGSTTLDLSTMAPHDCGLDDPYGGFGALRPPASGLGRTLGYGGSALAGALLLLRPRRRRDRRGDWSRWRRRLLLLAVVFEMAGLGGCGGRCTDFGTYPGSYTFKVNGAAPAAAPVNAGTTPGGGTATPNVSVSVSLTVKL